MLKIIVLVIVTAVIIGLGMARTGTHSPKPEEEQGINIECAVDDDCIVFGETGDCNCGCYHKDDLPAGTGGECFCLAPSSCKCVNSECEGVFEE